MPSSVVSFSVTKLRPGLQTMTLPSVIFMRGRSIRQNKDATPNRENHEVVDPAGICSRMPESDLEHSANA